MKNKINVVTIGGGSGGFVVDRGLSKYDINLTSITTSFDSGSNSGKLRDEFGTLPQGDLRRRILAQAQTNTHVLRDLFTHRFKSDKNLNDYSLGNLILTAANQLYGEQEGVDAVANLFGVRGRILPISYDKKADLCAELSDGSVLVGEDDIYNRSNLDERSISKIFLKPKAFISSLAKESILQADYLVICPGSLYSSICPCFLVDGWMELLQEFKGKIIWIPNLMTRKSESNGFTLKDFLEIIEKYLTKRIDFILVNDKEIPEDIIKIYREKEMADKIPVDINDSRVCKVDILSRHAILENMVRRSSDRLANSLMNIFSDYLKENKSL